MPKGTNTTPVSHAPFQTTHWSVVLAAAQDGTTEACQALESLCADYWYPIYAWLRRQNHSSHDAEDLTQSFLVHLLDGHRLQTVHPDKGRFRSFLLASLKNFLSNERDRANALKRAPTVTGPWSTHATLVAPAHGLIEFVDTNTPPVSAFYRTRTP